MKRHLAGLRGNLYDPGSEAAQGALEALREDLLHVGFRVTKRYPNENTLRVYPRKLLTPPLLNPRFSAAFPGAQTSEVEGIEVTLSVKVDQLHLADELTRSLSDSGLNFVEPPKGSEIQGAYRWPGTVFIPLEFDGPANASTIRKDALLPALRALFNSVEEALQTDAANSGSGSIPRVGVTDELVERWRGYLASANQDKEYIERHRLRDEHREQALPEIRTLILDFFVGAKPLEEFKNQFDSNSKKKWAVFGLKGFGGAMFLNQIAKNIPDQERSTDVLRQVMQVPKDQDEAKKQIDDLVAYLDGAVEAGVASANSLKSGNAAFFLSACWHSLAPETWPILYLSARGVFYQQGLLDRQLHDGARYIAFVDSFSSLADALGISFWTLEHLCDRLAALGEVHDEAAERPKVWLVAPGEQARMFDAFYEEGIVGIGWGSLGDLSKFSTLEDLKAALQEDRGGDVSPVQASYACWQFVNDMEVGDLIFAKKGRRKIVGYGKVTGDYRHEPGRGDYPNVRSVEWTDRGEWGTEDKLLVTKTLTDIGKYPLFVEQLKALVGMEAPAEPPQPEDAPIAVYGLTEARADLFAAEEDILQAVELLKHKKNLVLQGPPGVGKTFFAKHLAYLLMGEKDADRVSQVQFHQSYSYEDFVQGYRPDAKGTFQRTDGVFLRFCKLALQDPAQEYVFIIDEINRGNLSKILGELMLLIEADKRSPKWQTDLTYGRDGDPGFYVPENLYIIGTMNTADRSLAMVDYALRRRFVFLDVGPGMATDGFRGRMNEIGVTNAMASRIQTRLERLNAAISEDRSLGTGFCIGHSYFCSKLENQDEQEWYRRIVRTEIAPLLREYWFDDRTKADEQAQRLLEP